jgi:hypothetical protein
MIVSLTKIYCPSELQQKRTHTVYRNVTEYNKKNTAMIRQHNLASDTILAVFFVYFYTVLRCDKKGGALFYLRSDGQYILLDCPSELQQKRTHTVYRNVTEYNKKNTAMIVSLTKMYCPSDFKQKRTPKVYIFCW